MCRQVTVSCLALTLHPPTATQERLRAGSVSSPRAGGHSGPRGATTDDERPASSAAQQRPQPLSLGGTPAQQRAAATAAMLGSSLLSDDLAMLGGISGDIPPLLMAQQSPRMAGDMGGLAQGQGSRRECRGGVGAGGGA